MSDARSDRLQDFSQHPPEKHLHSRRIAKIYDLTDAKAKDRIIKTDKKRSSYYNYYTSKRWGDADSYDLCIDSGKMGVDGSVELVLNAIQLKEKGYKTAIY